MGRLFSVTVWSKANWLYSVVLDSKPPSASSKMPEPLIAATLPFISICPSTFIEKASG